MFATISINPMFEKSGSRCSMPGEQHYSEHIFASLTFSVV